MHPLITYHHPPLTLYHVACIFRPPLGLVMDWITALWLLKVVQNVRAYQTELRLLLLFIHSNQHILDLYSKQNASF